MENGGSLFSSSDRPNGNGHANNHLSWGLWELGTSIWTGNSASSFNEAAAASAARNREASGAHALLCRHEQTNAHQYHNQSALLYGCGGEGGGRVGGSQLHPDPHLMCLKLGKRHYFEDAAALDERHEAGFAIAKRGRPYYGNDGAAGPSQSPPVTMSAAAVPRCQVEGCHVALVNAKDYHRRHKVCEMHSKAPKVVVLGVEQRFCQQCSRFHAVSEFDDSKRSCRRRLAGHNERRRKSSHDSIARNPSQDNKLMAGRFPYLSSPTGRALSLLSSKTDSWVSQADLSSRSSAALRELIAENRAAVLARQLILDREWHWQHQAMEDLGTPSQTLSISHLPHQHLALPESSTWERFHEGGAHVTLDLMQAPSSAFEFLSMRGKSKQEVEECSELWNSLEGAHVV